MKRLYIILLVIIVFYLVSKTEKFTSVPKDETSNKYTYYESPNQFNLMNVPSILNDNSGMILPGFNDNTIQYKENISNKFNYDIMEPLQKKFINPNNITIPKTITHENLKYNYFGIAYNHYYMQYYILYEKEMTKNEDITATDFTNDISKSIEINTIYNDINVEDLKKGSNALSNNLYKEFYMNPALLKVDETKYLNDKLYSYLLVKISTKQQNNKSKESTQEQLPRAIIVHSVGPRSKINFNDLVYFSVASFQLGPLLVKKYKL